jgi:hypothetical protein
MHAAEPSAVPLVPLNLVRVLNVLGDGLDLLRKGIQAVVLLGSSRRRGSRRLHQRPLRRARPPAAAGSASPARRAGSQAVAERDDGLALQLVLDAAGQALLGRQALDNVLHGIEAREDANGRLHVELGVEDLLLLGQNVGDILHGSLGQAEVAANLGLGLGYDPREVSGILDGVKEPHHLAPPARAEHPGGISSNLPAETDDKVVDAVRALAAVADALINLAKLFHIYNREGNKPIDENYEG